MELPIVLFHFPSSHIHVIFVIPQCLSIRGLILFPEMSTTALPVQKYLDALSRVLGGYIEKYPWCSEGQQQWRIQESFNIQMYKPKEGYTAWHCERPTATIPVICRHLVFMTYLNDLKDEGGETEWYHQKLKIRPEKGLTIIWPVDWPFTHRGIPSMTETKYITTGWYSYY